MCETAAYRRHDISDRVWNILAPLLPGGLGKVGRPAQDNRRFINAVFWVLRTGAPWRDLPPDYGAGAVGGNQAIGRTKGGPTPNCIWRSCPRNAGQFAGNGGNGGGLYPGGGAD